METRRYALIGHPVEGSLSPRLFEAAYGGRYRYDLIDEPDFDRAWERATAYDGFNVTAPFKKLAALRADVRSEAVLESGSANTIVRTPEGLKAYNTDIDGVLGALSEDPEASALLQGASAATVLIVGCGGAAMAAYAALKDRCRLLMAVRSEASLQKAFSACQPAADIPYFLLDDPIPSVDLIVYTLPGSAPIPAGLPLDGAIILEAEYKQPRLARHPHYISGRRWLLHQGMAAYRLMTGEEPGA